MRNDGHDYQPGAPDGKSSEIVWIRLTRPSGKETVGKCSKRQNLEGVRINTVCLSHPSGLIGFVSASLASSRPPKGLILAAAAALC